MWGCLALLLVGLHLIAGPKITLSQWSVTPDANAALEEALQWKKGTMALSRSYSEMVVHNGTRYNIVGPGFVFVSLIGSMLTGWTGGSPDTFYPPYYVAMVALPIPFVAYWAFRSVLKSRKTGLGTSRLAWAAVLSAYLIVGTSLLPVLAICKDGSIYYINHALAVVGLLVFAVELLGRRRIWLAALGLCLAVWCRQMTCLYAIPLLWIAWRGHPRDTATVAQAAGSPTQNNLGQPTASSSTRRRKPRRDVPIAAACVAVIAAVPMTLNALKFGNPFDTGYTRMYQSHSGPIAQRARQQFFGPTYVKMHAAAMNTNFPIWELRGGTLYPVTVDIEGTSIWLTSPLLLGVFVTCRSWWRDRSRRVLMLSTLPVIAGLMCYHTTGAGGAGYYRYSLDFIPIWLLVIAPCTTGRRGVPLTLACLAYSALYFNLLP